MNRFMKSKRFFSHKSGKSMGLALVLLFSTFLTQLAAQVSVSITNKVDPSCSGYTDGSATAVATGGTAPYTYRWNNGVTGSTLSGGAGTYSVAATDALGRSGTVSVTINNPAPLTANISFADICAGGSVTATASGGTSPYTYNWGGGRTGATQAGIAGGSYTLTITDSKGCGAVKFVSVPAAFSVSLRIGALQCFGDCDAAIDALTSGGTAPFTYRWNTGATTAAIVGLPSGTYSLTVTDANGCTGSATGTVSNPPQIIISTSVTAPACGGGATGSATVTATGGRPPFTYKWSNGQTGVTATGLAVGDHFVTVMDAGGCNRTAKVVVASNAGFTIGLSKTDATCGASNGSATATVTGGGRAPFTYKWSTNATTSAITGIGAGTYTVSVTDANGCVNAASITVNAAGSLNVSVTGTNAACGIANGTATATATSGAAPFTYKWTTGATTQGITLLSSGTYTVTVTDANGCTAIASTTITTGSSIGVTIDARHVLCNGATTGQATAMVTGGSTPYTYRWSNGGNVAVIANIGAGTYTVTVTDATGCSGTQTTVITQPSALSITPSVTATSCGSNNGAASVSVSGGTAPYKYLWSTGSTTNSITGLVAGSYTLTVTDNNNCNTTASITVTSSNGLTLSMGSSNVSCNGGNNGTASANVTGASGTVTYAWSNGQTTSTINGLTAGPYSVTVTNGSCTTSGSVTLTQPTAISIAISLTNPTCGSNNGSLTASVSGGAPQYSYKWSNGATTASISGLAAGTYFVTVTDANNCSKTTSQAITAPNGPTATASATAVTCNGGNNGTASVTASGGTAPYTYNWGSSRTTATISGLTAGTYNVTVTDAAGCSSIGTATVTQPDAIVITTTVANAVCATGTITTVTVGGNGGYTYLWSNGQSTTNVSVSPGTYSLTVTDSKGCTQAKTGIVVGGAVSTLNCLIRITQLMTGNNTNDAKAQLEAYNGQGPYTYKWSTGAITQTVSNLAAGTITGTVTDALGCTSTCTATIVNNLCSSVTNPGTIAGNQMFCLASEVQGLTETSPASGGNAADAIEYLWMYSTTETNFDRNTWGTLTATGKDLPASAMPLSPIIGRISIVRCVRRANCSEYIESNVVTLTPKAFAFVTGVRNACLGESNTFTAGDNGAGATYTWTFAGANIATATGKIQTVQFNSLGQKAVTLRVNANSCTQTTTIMVNVTTCLGVYGGFVGFNANALTEKEVMLDWATTNEIRSSRYLIEKSVDGINFVKIGEVASQNGGNNLYRFADAEPKRGRSFYRVHQVAALDNTDVATTAAKKVMVGQTQGVLTYPNPAQTAVFVEVLDVDNAEGIIEIYNHIGSLIQTQQFDKTQTRYQVNIENLPMGTYILKIRNANGNSNSVKINKL